MKAPAERRRPDANDNDTIQIKEAGRLPLRSLVRAELSVALVVGCDKTCEVRPNTASAIMTTCACYRAP